MVKSDSRQHQSLQFVVDAFLWRGKEAAFIGRWRHLVIVFQIVLVALFVNSIFDILNQPWFPLLPPLLTAPVWIPMVLGFLNGPLKLHDISPLEEKAKGRLYVRIVTRGTNKSLVQRTMDQALQLCRTLLSRNQYHLEILTDHSHHFPESRDVTEIVVPEYFTCSTRYKGRALEYANQPGVSQAKDTDWILHLDEESTFDLFTLKSIVRYMCAEEKHAEQNSGVPRIGQGVIVYGHQPTEGSWSHLFCTLMDSVRVMDDLGRLRFQTANLHKSIYGFKGSYLLVPCNVEKKVGFDHGADSSAAEDAYFATFARSKGFECNFIHGLVYERSPFNLSDLFMQRRRWYNGLCALVMDPTVPFFARKEILSILLVQTANMVCQLYCLSSFIFGVSPLCTSIFLNPVMCIAYLMGFFYSIKRDLYSTKEYCVLVCLQFVLAPVFSFMESLTVLYALMNPCCGFHIVQKESSRKSLADPGGG